ncbi:MAG: general secretion pathway protein GspE [Burkholderiales bacterium RIFCSPLOWO2_12_67_14]|nr:MAG: general secretion pathway protein GspE [Burkholderiales bacterium RIFCSPLOWO2_02_FULL_67_64]OGB39986.1 MAG: general secretion pathway protein GspE [Burkholderiales bacterium RIFCSPHIGHO2_12_FULL_67_38]OGB43966.1 MAG: general secretion pathway protein GspE [Burkholderiales bacterium RIFCSPLOWO2_12_67_14]OGB87171.1 MAG: general secretion pathway protein GspE [Burkholderiales bacterium RIFCSPLOWO2_12_FULL_67_210]
MTDPAAPLFNTPPRTPDFRRYREVAQRQGRPLLDVMSSDAGISVRQACEELARAFGLRMLDSAGLQALEPAFSAWPLTLAQQRRALLMSDAINGKMIAVTTDPFETSVLVQLEHAAQSAIEHTLATAEDIHAYLHLQESSLRAMDQLGTETEALDTAERLSGVQILSLASVAEATSPAVRLVSSTLYDALRSGASDVHLECMASGLCIKYRIDGVLDEIKQTPGKELAEQVISRIKVIANLDIAERRVPQDGSFQVQAQERLIDLRVSIMPSIHGEDAVIRILDKQAIVEAHGRLSLDALGFDAGSIELLRELTQAAYGMLLVTGPTGSGKTTTLYAALTETHTGQDKIITIEDPVEYQLPGVLQIPVNERKGLTFARGLRSILRHDPDKIMVGEIRDQETAEIAVQSALTGHLVLTTVHANNVFDVFGRFTHMGLDPYALASALNGIWAQRLIRINCPNCSQPYVPDAADLRRFALSDEQAQAYQFMKGCGCGDCRGTGYRGRRAIAEILLLDDELRELIVQGAPVKRIKDHARQRGFATLQGSALTLVRKGLTTLEEVRRVTLSI